jgi:hypothetical protein
LFAAAATPEPAVAPGSALRPLRNGLRVALQIPHSACALPETALYRSAIWIDQSRLARGLTEPAVQRRVCS